MNPIQQGLLFLLFAPLANIVKQTSQRDLLPFYFKKTRAIIIEYDYPHTYVII